MPDPRLATLLPSDRGRIYTHPVTREQHVSSTTVLKVLAKELSRWAAALAAGEAWDNREWLLGVSRAQAIDALAGAPFRQRDEKGDHGSYVHRGAELLALSAAGYPLSDEQARELTALLTAQGESVRAGIARFAEWAATYVAEWIHLEQTVWGNGWAGTFDTIVRLKDGRVALVDYKTGKGIYREVKQQLASYRYAEAIIKADGTRIELPPIDLCAVVHLPETGGYSFLDLKVDPDDLEAFEHTLEDWHWTQRVPLNPGTAIPVATAPGVPGVAPCGDRRKGGSIACDLDAGHPGDHHGKSSTGSRNYVWADEQPRPDRDTPTSASGPDAPTSAPVEVGEVAPHEGPPPTQAPPDPPAAGPSSSPAGPADASASSSEGGPEGAAESHDPAPSAEPVPSTLEEAEAYSAKISALFREPVAP